MGMDVYGQNPETEKGRYFRASIWSWPAIYSLTTTLCSDLLDEETIRDMAINCGAGSKSTTVCKQMAHRLRDWLRKSPTDYAVYVEHEHTMAGQLEAQLVSAGWNIIHNADCSSRRATNEHLQQWADFLDSCGGFEVW